MLHPDAILHNGDLLTLNDRHPHATALAIEGDRIAFVGDEQATLALAATKTKVVNLHGRTVVPGFCDSHLHLVWYGMNLIAQADLVGAKSVDEVLARLADMADRTGGWIRGHGFDQSKLAGQRFPTREELDRVSADRPVIISRVCGHAGVANSAAVALLSDTQRAAGDADTGLYTEQAFWAFYSYIPTPAEEELERAILAAGQVLLRTGITSVQTMLDTPGQMSGLSRLHRAGRLPVRVVAMPPYSAVEQLYAHGVRTGLGDSWLKFGAAKLFSDGSLGAQTALLSEPYADKPGTVGLRIYEPEDLKFRVLDAQEKGFQVAIHAIGDQAVRESLDAIEHALDRDPLKRGNGYHRHRIEHASLCPPDCVQRMASRKVVATFQPQFVTSDTWTGQRVGARRLPWAYPFESLRAAGVPITLSSDAPVEVPNAFEALASAVGRHAWSPDETMSPVDAIRAYCLGSAFAGHNEHQLGSLEPGKLADMVVLSGNPRNMPPAALRTLKAEQVWLAGRPIKRT